MAEDPTLDDADTKEAKAQLAAMGDDVHFRSPRKRRLWLVIILSSVVVGLGFGANKLYERHLRMTEPRPRPSIYDRGEGCPCGCDRSAKMAAELRRATERAPRAIESTLVTIAERESASYITERMIQHRLRMLDLAGELHVGAEVRDARLVERADAAAIERCKVASVTSSTVRVCSELVVHGERTEIVDGHDKVITSSFRLWLEIENLGGAERVIAQPTIDAGPVHLPISRWYEESGAGQPWSGVLRAGERVRVNVIGDIPEHIAPDTVVDAKIEVGSVAFAARAEAQAVIHLQR